MQFNDSDWLGDYADLGPAARAGLGILLEKEDWSWWSDPFAASEALRRAVTRHGIARWGGDLNVLEAYRWVEPSLAIAVASGFQALFHLPLRIKIARTVWRWQGFEESIDAIREDLARAVVPERIFAEWPQDTRPHFPRVDRGRNHALIITGSRHMEYEAQALLEAWPQATWIPDAYASDIIVASSAEEIEHMGAARLAVVFENDTREVSRRLTQLRNRNCVRCLVRVVATEETRGQWLAAFSRAWNLQVSFIDDAIFYANAQTQAFGQIVASTQSFILQSDRFLRPEEEMVGYSSGRSVRLIGEPKADGQPDSADGAVVSPRHDAFHSDLSSLYEGPRRSPIPSRMGPPAARVLDAVVKDESGTIDFLPLKGAINISLDIRLKTPLHGDRPVFPGDRVEWEGDSKVLYIHMVELGREPVSRPIKVHRAGQSGAANFAYDIDDRAVDLRFLVSDGPRILQTARLQGNPGEQIEFFVESIAASVEQQKKPFDVALLVNDSLGGRPSATTLTSEGIGLSLLDAAEIVAARNAFREILERIVINPDEPVAPVLLELASEGSLLLEFLRRNVKGWPDRIERVQLVTQANAYFPLEYLYEGRVPESGNASLCPESRSCLDSGKALSPCTIREAATHLCPMGFLGVSAVIERQTWQPGMQQPIWLKLSQDLAERQKINDLSRAVFSASNVADDFPDDAFPEGQKPVRIADIASAVAPCMTDWGQWKQRVELTRPSLLVLVAHIERGQLFIGNKEGLPLAALGSVHVGTGNPVAIAIGCNSALGRIAGTSLPAVLMARGARVVVAALTEVLGRHASKAALQLAQEFRRAAASPTPIAIGELLAKLRRQFLAEEIALGLVLVAFGDADIALGGQ